MRLHVLLAAALATVALPASSARDTGTLAAVQPQQTAAPPVTSYLRNVSQPIPGVSWMTAITEHHRITMADGVELDAWVVRPDIAGPLPVVMQITPYYGGGDPTVTRPASGAANYPYNISIQGAFQELIKRGYAWALVSVRGTGSSGGCFSIGGPQEGKDLAAAVDYLAALPWSNGRVGAMGVSYDGTAPQDLWVEAPPALKTIVPISGISDMYRYNYVNGVPIDDTVGFNTYYWLLTGTGPAGLYGGSQLIDPVTAPDAVVGEACRERVEVTAETFTSFIRGNKTAYWQARDHVTAFRADPARKRASVFYIHGLQDWNVKPHNMEGWIEALQRANVPFKAWLGQWAHAYPNRADWTTVMTAWFDQFLKNRDTGILDAPRIQVQDDAGKWRHESAWPAKGGRITLYPRSSGVLATSPGTGYADFNDYLGQDVNESTPLPDDRIAFASAPLAQPLQLSGMPRFEGIVGATGARANLMLTLAEQKPDGTLRPFNYASLSLNHANDVRQGAPSVAGVPQYVAVNFHPQEDVVAAGSRVVLIAAGDLVFFGQPGPNMKPIATGSDVVLDLRTSKLVLPYDVTLAFEEL